MCCARINGARTYEKIVGKNEQNQLKIYVYEIQCFEF